MGKKYFLYMWYEDITVVFAPWERMVSVQGIVCGIFTRVKYSDCMFCICTVW
jgi:hypothetical protein